MRFIPSILAILALSGCATMQLDEGLKGLVGRNIQEAVARFGYPDDQRFMMGDIIYVWSTNRQGVLPMAMTTTTNGAVGSTPFYGTTTGMRFIPIGFNCTVQIATDKNGAIKNYQWEGNEGGCKRYARGFSHR